MSETELRFADRVRSPDDLRKLADFERTFYLPLLLSAILPIVTAGSGSATDSWVSITVDVVARLARIVRLLFVSKGTRTAISRLGKVGVFALGMLLLCSWTAYVAESPTNKELATFGDSLWWGVVTLTTVGYGDIVPITEKGRFAGVFLMFTGLTTLGLIAGTLASAFGLSPADDGPPAPAGDGNSAEVMAELRALRAQLDTLTRQLPATGPPGDQ